MKYLKIQNRGILDIRLVSLMGGSTKTGNVYKIGQFGTGLKYSFAYLLRNNIQFHVFLGENKVHLSTKSLEIQGTDFEVIYIDGKETSLTTNMGPDWQPWMIIRELWCNALDESEAKYEVVNVENDHELLGHSDTTQFYIQLVPEIKEVLRDWSKYFIHERQPMFTTIDGDHRVYACTGNSFTFYKQGVLIREVDNLADMKLTPPVFLYDQKYSAINELREFKGSISQSVARILSSISDVDTIRYFYSNIKDTSYESSLDLNWFDKWNEAWIKALDGRKLIHTELINQLIERNVLIDYNAVCVVPKSIYKVLTSQYKDSSAVIVTEGKNSEFFEKHDFVCEAKVNEAVTVLANCGYEVHPETRYVFGYFSEPNVYARVDTTSKRVFVSNIHRDKDLFDIMTMVVEENEHIRTGYKDESRNFQQHFIDMYVNLLTQKQQYHVENRSSI